MTLARVAQHAKVYETIRIVSEYFCFSVSSLQYMERTSRYNDSWKSHGIFLTEGARRAENYIEDAIRCNRICEMTNLNLGDLDV